MVFSAPLVSVVVPAFNGERTIHKTLSSIIDQDYQPLELIVIDDGSTDSTANSVKDFMANNRFFGSFSLVIHEKNLGLSKTLNDGVNRAKSDFVLILHQDCEFVGNDWVSKALSIMKSPQIAVVTGYYGLSDSDDETFVKRAFGVIRKQFHSRPTVSCEEATFSEGKSDMYRKSYLVQAGGFPTAYRIAGEDLIVSYTLRHSGYKIIKCYDLAVIQRFTGAAETFKGNLSKEFLFGKVMGGVFSKFKFFLFKGVKNSEYSGSRSLHRASQPIFVTAFIILSILLVISWFFGLGIVGLLLYRYLYYVNRINGELQKSDNVKNPLRESIIMAPIGILTDFAYTFGFGYGLIRNSLGRKL